MKFYTIIKRAIRQWLLRSLTPCQQMVKLMSESMERQLTLGQYLKLRWHLLVCAWCARYLKQIKFLRWVAREKIATATNRPTLALTAEARKRIADSLNQAARGDRQTR